MVRICVIFFLAQFAQPSKISRSSVPQTLHHGEQFEASKKQRTASALIKIGLLHTDLARDTGPAQPAK